MTIGAGSVGVALQVLYACTSPGDEVVYGWRSFDAYPIIARMAKVKPIKVPLTPSGEQDLDSMRAAGTERTRVIVVCNPHNPTGAKIERAALDNFLESVPGNVVVILGEAYAEFGEGVDMPRGQDYLGSRHSIVVLRTFSKAYGLPDSEWSTEWPIRRSPSESGRRDYLRGQQSRLRRCEGVVAS